MSRLRPRLLAAVTGVAALLSPAPRSPRPAAAVTAPCPAHAGGAAQRHRADGRLRRPGHLPAVLAHRHGQARPPARRHLQVLRRLELELDLRLRHRRQPERALRRARHRLDGLGPQRPPARGRQCRHQVAAGHRPGREQVRRWPAGSASCTSSTTTACGAPGRASGSSTTAAPSSPSRADDNACHRTHVHISLSWNGAFGRTTLLDEARLGHRLRPVPPQRPELGLPVPAREPQRLPQLRRRRTPRRARRRRRRRW